MATMTCESCQTVFEGRPNRKYCSVDCRRTAEMKEREIKRKERYNAWLAALTPEERERHNSIPKAEDRWADLPSWGKEKSE